MTDEDKKQTDVIEGPLPFICPGCSAVFVIADYVPDGVTLYLRCRVCRRKLKVTPDNVEIEEDFASE